MLLVLNKQQFSILKFHASLPEFKYFLPHIFAVQGFSWSVNTIINSIYLRNIYYFYLQQTNVK